MVSFVPISDYKNVFREAFLHEIVKLCLLTNSFSLELGNSRNQDTFRTERSELSPNMVQSS